MGIVRKTKSVKKMLEVFGQSKNAVSVVGLVERFKGDMNKTTVYRILERLEEEGIIHSFTGRDGLKWVAQCDGTDTILSHTDNHPHFQCNACGKSECLTIDISIPSVPNHKIDSAKLLLIGQCGDCLS